MMARVISQNARNPLKDDGIIINNILVKISRYLLSTMSTTFKAFKMFSEGSII
jgi:hypothetical protein